MPGGYAILAFLTAKRVVVRGRSMMPTLVPGERVLFDRLAYLREPPSSGDIVLARHAARPWVRMIKRVAARDGLDSEDLWLLGDNTGASTDSRALGPFRRDDVFARAWVVYWPPERFRLIKRP